MNFDKVIAVRKTKVVYKANDYCIKVFNAGYSKADILNEALNQARVEELPFNVPRLKSVTMVDGKWAITTEYIEGSTLAELMELHPSKKAEYLELFVDLQIMVQRNTSPLLTKLKDKFMRKIDLADVNSTTKYELQTRLESMPKGNSVCHGDFNPSNIIIDKTGDPYIFDWSHATQGNPCADVARTYLLFWLANETELADEYMDLYCKKTGKIRRDVQRWLPIVAISQSVKGNENERELLLSWANVVDYE